MQSDRTEASVEAMAAEAAPVKEVAASSSCDNRKIDDR
jgi:hypothetical protein